MMGCIFLALLGIMSTIYALNANEDFHGSQEDVKKPAQMNMNTWKLNENEDFHSSQEDVKEPAQMNMNTWKYDQHIRMRREANRTTGNNIQNDVQGSNKVKTKENSTEYNMVASSKAQNGVQSSRQIKTKENSTEANILASSHTQNRVQSSRQIKTKGNSNEANILASSKAQNGVQSSSKTKTKENSTEANIVTSSDGDIFREYNKSGLEEGPSWRNAMNEAEQQNRIKNIIVSGNVIRRVYKGESLMRSVEQIGHKLGIQDPLADVQMARRIYLPDKTKGAMIIQLKSTLIKEKWIQAYRKRSLWREKWFLNEHLTKQNFELLKMTRVMAKNQSWCYVWTRFCKIYTRKNQGTKIYEVKSPDQLYSIFNIEKPKYPPKQKKIEGSLLTTNNSAIT